jgi:hypothetical protein
VKSKTKTTTTTTGVVSSFTTLFLLPYEMVI